MFDHPEDVFVVSELSEPLITVVAFSYEVPAFSSNKFVRAALGGWTFGGMVRYASGMPIPVPASQNQISALTFQTTTMNRVEGRAVVHEGPERRRLRSERRFRAESGRMGQSCARTVRHLAGLLRRFPLSASARRAAQRRPELPDPQSARGSKCAPNSSMRSTAFS